MGKLYICVKKKKTSLISNPNIINSFWIKENFSGFINKCLFLDLYFEEKSCLFWDITPKITILGFIEPEKIIFTIRFCSWDQLDSIKKNRKIAVKFKSIFQNSTPIFHYLQLPDSNILGLLKKTLILWKAILEE